MNKEDIDVIAQELDGAFVDDIPKAELINPINIDEIDESSQSRADEMMGTLIKLYDAESILDQFPQTKIRLNIELDTLQGLLKMRISDAQAHDILLNAMSMAPSNASLYRAFSEIQKTSLQVTTKINETINNINNILNEFRSKLDARGHIRGEDQEDQDELDNKNISRGSKQFITGMINEDDVI